MIRPATAQDLPTIAAIQQASPEAAQWPATDYLAYACLVYEEAGSVAAFLVARTVAPGEHELLNLAVAPSFRRRGLARKLLHHAVNTQPGAWFLEVRASNSSAIALYGNCGFSILSRRPGYYHSASKTSPESAPEGAIVMRRTS